MLKASSIPKVFLVAYLMLAGQVCKGQNEFSQHHIDSLKNIDLRGLDNIQRAEIHYHIAENYTYWMVDSSILYAERALNVFRNAGIDDGIRSTLGIMVEQLYINGELYKSIKYAFELESMLLASNQYQRLPSLYNSIGNNLKRQGDFKGALTYYYKSAKHSKEQKQLIIFQIIDHH